MFFRIGFLMLMGIVLAGCGSSQHNGNETESKNALIVYKSPTCGCCRKWIDHMQEVGFETDIVNRSNLSGIKKQYGIAKNAQSCHTSIYQDKYVFEGHIPAKMIQQFIDNPPSGAKGLVVPGMPIGSPGMESGSRFQPYKVWLLKENGEYSEYGKIESYDQQFAVSEG